MASGGQRLLLPHGGSVTAAAYSPDGKRLVSIGRDRLVKVWDPANGALIATVVATTYSNTGLSVNTSYVYTVSAFDAAVKEIGARYETMTFKYTGPWPPYNFVNIRLKLERAREATTT